MIKIKQTIVVEGKYDKSKLSSFIDATIITTEGFDIFRDKEKLALLRRLARQDGIIVLTDSDRAGCLIRSHIAGAIPPQQIIFQMFLVRSTAKKSLLPKENWGWRGSPPRCC